MLSATGLARLLDVPASELGHLLTVGRTDDIDTRVREFANRLGNFLSTLEIDFDLVVIAGGLAASFNRIGEAIAARVEAPVVAAQLGGSGALLGAVELAFPRSPIG